MGTKDRYRVKCAIALKRLSDEGRLEFRGSRTQLAWLFAASLATVTGLLLLEFGYFGDTLITPFISWLIIGVLAWTTPVVLLRLVQARDPLIVIDRTGIRDRRTFSGVIPWSVVDGIGAMKVERQSCFTMRVAPSFQREIQWRPLPRFFELLRFEGPTDLVQLGVYGVETDIHTLVTASFAAASSAGIILQPLGATPGQAKAA